MSDDDADGWADYESGPFCRHWGTPGDCERPCDKCGHTCDEHPSGEYRCTVDGCECDGFEGEGTGI